MSEELKLNSEFTLKQFLCLLKPNIQIDEVLIRCVNLATLFLLNWLQFDLFLSLNLM